MKTYLRGHEIEEKEGIWLFSDTKEPTVDNWESRPCGKCNKHNTPEGHDACLGTLPSVMNACCGHGQDNTAYVQLLDKTIISGVDALDKINELKQ